MQVALLPLFMSFAVDAVMKKWANLRTYYLKETQKLEKKNSEVEGTDQVYIQDVNIPGISEY